MCGCVGGYVWCVCVCVRVWVWVWVGVRAGVGGCVVGIFYYIVVVCYKIVLVRILLMSAVFSIVRHL